MQGFDTDKWAGAVVAILGGGPGLTPAAVDACRRVAIVTAVINNSVEAAPWADMLYFCDKKRWYDHHRGTVRAYARAGRGVIVTLENQELAQEIPGLICLRRGPTFGLAEDPPFVATGGTSLCQVLNLFVHLSVKRALLVGFDMRPVAGRMHWHKNHPVPTPLTAVDQWIKGLCAASPHLVRRGLEVINCTPDSALDCFPRQTLMEALA